MDTLAPRTPGRRCCAVSALILVVTATPAAALKTFTPPLYAFGGNQVSCFVQNVGDAVESVDITLRNQANEIIATTDAALLPGEGSGIARSEDIPGANCVFEFAGDPTREIGDVATIPTIRRGPPGTTDYPLLPPLFPSSPHPQLANVGRDP